MAVPLVSGSYVKASSSVASASKEQLPVSG